MLVRTEVSQLDKDKAVEDYLVNRWDLDRDNLPLRFDYPQNPILNSPVILFGSGSTELPDRIKRDIRRITLAVEWIYLAVSGADRATPFGPCDGYTIQEIAREAFDGRSQNRGFAALHRYLYSRVEAEGMSPLAQIAVTGDTPILIKPLLRDRLVNSLPAKDTALNIAESMVDISSNPFVYKARGRQQKLVKVARSIVKKAPELEHSLKCIISRTLGDTIADLDGVSWDLIWSKVGDWLKTEKKSMVSVLTSATAAVMQCAIGSANNNSCHRFAHEYHMGPLAYAQVGTTIVHTTYDLRAFAKEMRHSGCEMWDEKLDASNERFTEFLTFAALNMGNPKGSQALADLFESQVGRQLLFTPFAHLVEAQELVGDSGLAYPPTLVQSRVYGEISFEMVKSARSLVESELRKQYNRCYTGQANLPFPRTRSSVDDARKPLGVDIGFFDSLEKNALSWQIDSTSSVFCDRGEVCYVDVEHLVVYALHSDQMEFYSPAADAATKYSVMELITAQDDDFVCPVCGVTALDPESIAQAWDCDCLSQGVCQVCDEHIHGDSCSELSETPGSRVCYDCDSTRVGDCVICSDPIGDNDDYILDSNGNPVCGYCRDQDMFYCADCGEYWHNEEASEIFIENTLEYVCESCFDTGSYGYCAKCGLAFTDDNLTKVEGADAQYHCDDCRKKHETQGDDNE